LPIVSAAIVSSVALPAGPSPASGEPRPEDPTGRLQPLDQPAGPVESQPGDFFTDIGERDTLTGGWFGFAEDLNRRGLVLSLSTTNVYQINARGGRSTHDRQGRWSGSYDLELEADLQSLVHLPGAFVYAHAEGSWQDGIDPESIGSAVGNVNGDAAGDLAIILAELWYQQSLLDGRLHVRIGKLDLTGGFEVQGSPVSFDGNAFANDETSQFLNAALVNNPTIPFPDYALGAVMHYEPIDALYVSAGIADARGDGRETGFNTAMHDEDYFFAIFEAGYVPTIPCPRGGLEGAYRVGFWYDPQPKQRFGSGSTKRDDVGLYLSFDQKVYNENDVRDGQGLGLFARYGWADSDVNEITCFWSAGVEYQGLLPTRDFDVLGFGVASGKLSSQAGYTDRWETVYELYYGLVLTPWAQLTPSIQYIQDPGADDAADDAMVLGLRLQVQF
jgi:porin